MGRNGVRARAGQAGLPVHWHFGEEEWLLVVSGAPTLRTPEGEQVLRAWDVAVFVTGEAGAHEVRNDTDEPVRVVMLSSVSDPEVCVYPGQRQGRRRRRLEPQGRAKR